MTPAVAVLVCGFDVSTEAVFLRGPSLRPPSRVYLNTVPVQRLLRS
jgi:hypothetical protein